MSDGAGKMNVDWTKLTRDPNDPVVFPKMRDELVNRRKILRDTDPMAYILQRVASKSVLDIGIAAHDFRYLNAKDWKHALIADVASKTLGIDIIEDIVREVSKKGWNVRCVDATSNIDLGERFDVVHIGDVIEHVPDPSALLRFAGRHLSPNGRIIVTTPNCFALKFLRRLRADHVVVGNFDHVCWISPTNALELARRTGLCLDAYVLAGDFRRASRRLKYFRDVTLRRFPEETMFPDYIFEFIRTAE